MLRSGAMSGSGTSSAPVAHVGVDVGGTFTDAVCIDSLGRVSTAKVASTPADPSVAVLRAVAAVSGSAVVGRSTLSHGTTVATNAVLEAGLPRTVLVATDGFTDVLDYRDGRRDDPYDLDAVRPDPLVAREDRVGVVERIAADGSVLTALADDEIARVVADVVALRPDVVAVCLLFSHVEPAHESLLAEALRAALPGVQVVASHEVSPAPREYPRTVTTVVSAALRPVVAPYLARIDDALPETFEQPMTVMTSSGASLPGEAARALTHRLLLSGPAAGVAGAGALAALHGLDDIVCFDMGGTSLDVAHVPHAQPRSLDVFMVGSHPVLAPAVDMVTIGTGGGSVVRVDDAGRLTVGPDSAGADPGPVCYGRGGQRPTLTDAFCVLGLLADARLPGIDLDRSAALDAFEELGAALGTTAEEAASAAVQMAAAGAGAAVRRVTAEKGIDPRDSALLAYGGGGPMLASFVLADTGIPRLLIPNHPGLMCARGLLAAERSLDELYAVMAPLDDGLVAELNRWAEPVAQRLAERLEPAVAPKASISLACRYRGQGFDIPVTTTLPLESAEAVAEAFAAEHRARYGHGDSDLGIEVSTARVVVHDVPAVPMTLTTSTGIPHPRNERTDDVRTILWGATPLPTRFIAHADLVPGDEVDGPAVVDMADSTAVIGPGQSLRVLQDASMLVTVTA
jgi:N-methylhydantoinase A